MLLINKTEVINNRKEGEKRLRKTRDVCQLLSERPKVVVIIYEMPVLRHACCFLLLPFSFSSSYGCNVVKAYGPYLHVQLLDHLLQAYASTRP